MFRRIVSLLMFLALAVGLACGGGGGGSAPNPPTGLQATASPNNFDEVDFVWSPPSGGISGYEGQMRIGAGEWQSLGVTIPADAIGGSLTFSGTVPENVLLVFRLRSLNGTSSSAWSNEADLQRGIRPPSGLTVRYDFTGGGAALAWTRSSLVSDGAKVERSADSGMTWAVLAGGAGATSAFLDTTAQAYTPYTYRVSNLLAATASLPCAPAGLAYQVDPVVYPSGVTLGWAPFGLTFSWGYQPGTAPAGVTGFRVERRAPDGSVTGWDLDGTATTYLDTTVAPNQVYNYRAICRFGTGYGMPGGFSGDTLAGIAGPLGVQALVNANPYGIGVSWWNPPGPAIADGVRVEGAQSNATGALVSAWTQVAAAAGLPSSTVDTTCQEENLYVYRVTYLRGTFVGLPSAPSAPYQAPLVPPTNFLATPQAGGIRLTWQNQSTKATNLHLSRYPTGTYADSLALTGMAALPASTSRYDDMVDMGFYSYWMFPEDGTANSEGVGTATVATPAPADALVLNRTALANLSLGDGPALRPSGSWIMGDYLTGTVFSSADPWPQFRPADFLWTPYYFLAADAAGWPHFLYTRNAGAATEIVHAWFDGTAWNTAGMNQGAPPLSYNGLAYQLDAGGAPHALVDRATSASPNGATVEALTYLRPAGAAWTAEAIPDLGMGLGTLMESQIRLDPQGDAHLLLGTATEVAAWHRDAGGAWAAEVVPTGELMGEWGRFLDSAWTDAGNGWVLFQRNDAAPSSDYLLLAVQKLAGAWQAPVVLGHHPFPQNVYNQPRGLLAASADRTRLAVLYCSQTGLRIYHHDALGWHRTLVAPFPVSGSGGYALGFDGAAKVHFYGFSLNGIAGPQDLHE